MPTFDCRTDWTSEFALRTSDFARLARSRRIGSGSSRCFRTGLQRIEREDAPRQVSLEVMLRGTCDQARLLDLVENFTLFSEHKAGRVKIIGQNHQFLGVNNAIAAMLRLKNRSSGRESALTLAPYGGEVSRHRGKENHPRTPGQGQATAGPQLAAEVFRPRPAQARS